MEINNGINKFKSTIISIIDSKTKNMQDIYFGELEDIINTHQKEFPGIETECVDRNTLESFIHAIGIIIFTATPVERDTVLKHITPLDKKSSILEGYIENETYYVGKLGLYNIILTMCRPGSVQSALSSCDAFHFWKPRIAILCGIGFGLDKNKQNIGDVLISEQVVPYEVERVGKKKIPRGEPIPSSPILINRFKHEKIWNYLIREKKYKAEKIFGQMLSGEKLIDNKKFRKRLFKKFQNAKGGDMEGAGFSLAAFRKKIDWIIVKGICDWGYKKDKKYQKVAAESAINLVKCVLSNPHVFDEIENIT